VGRDCLQVNLFSFCCLTSHFREPLRFSLKQSPNNCTFLYSRLNCN